MTARPSPSARRSLVVPLSLAALVAAGLVLRLYHLGVQSFWFDEAQTLFIARLDLAQIPLRAYRPPLYHILLHFWGPLAGESEFWLRLPSALCGAAVPLAAYWAGKRLYGRGLGLLAAALAALSPTMIWYSQELRMYSLMALQFLLLLALAPRPADEEADLRPRRLVAIFLVEVSALYTHYFTIPFLLLLAGLGALTFLRTKRWRSLRTWLILQGGAAVAFGPWLWIIQSGRGGTSDYIAAETLPVVTQAPSVHEFLAQSWRFYTNSAITYADTRLYDRLSLATALLLGVALLLLIGRVAVGIWRSRHESPNEFGADTANLLKQDREGDMLQRAADISGCHAATLWSDVYLLALVVLPVAVGAVMFKLRPGVVAPRHLMMLSGPFLLLVARAIGQVLDGAPTGRWLRPVRGVHWLLGGALLAGVLAIFATGLAWYYGKPHDQRPNVRALARHLEVLTGPNDVVMLPYVDYALKYYFRGPADFRYVETRVGDADLYNWLLPLIPQARRIVLVQWVHSYDDGRDLLPWLLQSNGRLLSRDWEAERWVSVYDFTASIALPPLAKTEVAFGPLHLQAVTLPVSVPADQRVPVALEWRLASPMPSDLKVSVKALDEFGVTIAQSDRVLLSEKSGAETSKWPAGLAAHNYYLLALPPGTAPTRYTLAVSVYDARGALDVLSPQGVPTGALHRLGAFQLTPAEVPPTAFATDTPFTPLGQEVAPGLRLEGFMFHSPQVRSGEALMAVLYWHATATSPAAGEPELQVVAANGQVVGSQRLAPGYGSFPFSRWRQGELCLDRRRVPISPDAPSGPAQVRLTLDGQSVSLGEIQIEKTDRAFALPAVEYPLEVAFGNVARLRGFALSGTTMRRSQPPVVTLYWEAADQPIAASYAVFVHLLDPQNQMLAQHDGPPAAGKWPTTSWVKGQIVTDEHTLAFKEGDYQGEALIEVGMYDTVTFERLKLPTGEDHLILPIRVTVQP